LLASGVSREREAELPRIRDALRALAMAMAEHGHKTESIANAPDRRTLQREKAGRRAAAATPERTRPA
jgi:hypothetical protein